MCKLLEEAMERNDEMTERRVADRRVVAVAGSGRDAFEAWAKREGHDNFMRMAGDEDQYDDLILRANFKGWLGAAGAMAAPQQVDAVQAVPLTDEEIAVAYDAGNEVARRNGSATECNYPAGTARHERWMLGFSDGGGDI